MHDDDMMDRLLKDALTAEAPQLSPEFDARVMRSVQPRRLTLMGRFVIAIYIVVAVATAVWLMRDLRVEAIVAAVVIGVPLAAGASAYGRRLVLDR